MNLTIHRGTNEIGGSCVEFSSDTTRLLIDFGMPIVTGTGGDFDSSVLKNKSINELIELSILPNIDGLYHGNESVNAVLLSHSHIDHYGLLNHINEDIPVYLGKATADLIEINNIFVNGNIHIKNPQYFEEQTFLCIDMSVPTIQRIIDQMENFKAIKTLMITCSKGPVDVDLDDLLTRAKNYPLEQLHIINFKQFVTDVPETIDQFPNLHMLSVFNNDIRQLPASLVHLVSLQTLYADMNPVSTLLPMVESLSKLETLGIAKTNISESEIKQIKALLPNCKILAQ